jgi:hypothetical protein
LRYASSSDLDRPRHSVQPTRFRNWANSQASAAVRSTVIVTACSGILPPLASAFYETRRYDFNIRERNLGMIVVEDLRKLLESLVTPDLKTVIAEVKSNENSSKLRDDALSAKIDNKFELRSALLVANHATVMNALNLEKRIAAIEQKQGVAA